MAKEKARYIDKNCGALEGEHFGCVYSSIYKSPQFQSLTTAVKEFYSCCRAHAESKESIQCLYNHAKEERKTVGKDGSKYDYVYHRDFVFPANQLAEYGYDRSNASKYFGALEKAGFIDIREKNGHRYKVNVYSFSMRWKMQTAKKNSVVHVTT